MQPASARRGVAGDGKAVQRADWATVRRSFEAGMSKRRLGDLHGVSRQAVQKRARREGWEAPAGDAPGADAPSASSRREG